MQMLDFQVPHIRRVRTLLDLKQKDVAAGIGLEASRYSRLENGEIVIAVWHITALANFYKVDPALFWYGGELTTDVIQQFRRRYRGLVYNQFSDLYLLYLGRGQSSVRRAVQCLTTCLLTTPLLSLLSPV